MNYLDELKSIYNKYKKFDSEKIPLCAAENHVSSFSKQPLNSILEGKYITGFLYRNRNNDFIGSDYLCEILNLANKVAEDLYGFKYNDFRCLSGMNTVAIVLMCLVNKGDRILITTSDQGGHGSLTKLCDCFGIKYDRIPYNYETMTLKYGELNKLLNRRIYKYIFVCQSDVINPPDLKRIKVPEGTSIIYDATQTLGLIAGRMVESPCYQKENLIMIGGTHKTFPGVTCGQISTNSQFFIDVLDKKISPDYLRNPQINLITSVLMTMIEMKSFGKEYAKEIVRTANKLGKELEKLGFHVNKINKNRFTKTHQLFVQIDKSLDINAVYENFSNYGITINKRDNQYCYGLRIGTQEIARYGWSSKVAMLAKLIKMIVYESKNKEEILKLKHAIAKEKRNLFLLDDIFME